ncbi:1 TM domain-containing transmembrane protein [Acrasis kona]|uniref:1 TM domain-containing transmembrane protein n=1 Tax=Acrasis kona TaxID=1008807 RepID=A0AAW2ZGR4_9EUKA
MSKLKRFRPIILSIAVIFVTTLTIYFFILNTYNSRPHIERVGNGRIEEQVLDHDTNSDSQRKIENIPNKDCPEFTEQQNNQIGVREEQVYLSMVSGSLKLEEKARHSYSAWMTFFKPENNFIVTTTPKDISLRSNYKNWFGNSNIVEVKGSKNDYWSAQYRFYYAMKNMYKTAVLREDEDVRWFFVADDDSFVIPLNMYRAIAYHNSRGLHKKPVFLGMCNYPESDRFLGGAGVLISKPALKLLINFESLCEEPIQKQAEDHYYDLDVPRCFLDIASKLNIQVSGCYSAPQMFDRMLIDRCSKAYSVVDVMQPHGFRSYLESMVSYHRYYKKEDIDDIKSFYPQNKYFDIGHCPHYFSLSSFKKEDEAKVKIKERVVADSPSISIDVKRVDEANSDESILRAIGRKTKSDWTVIIGPSSCSDQQGLENMLYKYKSKSVHIFTGTASNKVDSGRLLPLGSGLIVSKGWVAKVFKDCKVINKSCIKSALQNARQHKIIVKRGEILEQHPLQFCTPEGKDHPDGKYRIDTRFVGIYGSYNGTCEHEVYEYGTQHFEMWMERQRMHDEEQD